jgi:hypothetical protein
MKRSAPASPLLMLILSWSILQALPPIADAQTRSPGGVGPAATILPKSVLASGGLEAQGSGVRLVGTLGQPLVNVASGSSLVMTQGFWFVSQAKPASIGGRESDGSIAGYQLGSWPNPFTTSMQLRYALSEAAHVAVNVYDIHGRLVRNLTEADRSVDSHIALWDGADDVGNSMPSGCYIIRLAISPLSIPGQVTMLDKPVMLAR